MGRRSGQKGDESANPLEFCENRRVLRVWSSSARTVEFCENRRVLQESSCLVTTENSVVGCAVK